MENSTKKSVGVQISKRNRSLDIKSLYKPRVSKVGGRKKKDAQENDLQNVKNKRKRNQKEVPLSSLEPDAKRNKEVVNVVKSEPDYDEKSGGKAEVHGSSLCLAETSKVFSFPRRPRGAMGRRKLVTDLVLKPLGIPVSGDHAGAFTAEVINLKDEAEPADKLVKSDLVSVGSNRVSKPKSLGKIASSNINLAGTFVSSNIKYLGRGSGSRSKSAGKSIASKLKTKLKGNSKSDGNVYSNVRLKRKAETNFNKGNQDDGSGSMPQSREENQLAMNFGGASSSKKRRVNSWKKTNLVEGRDGDESSEKKKNQKKKDSLDNRDVDEVFEMNNNQKKKDLADNIDVVKAFEKNSSKKKKGLVGRDEDEALEKNINRKKKNIVHGRDGDEALVKKNTRKKKKLVDGGDGVEAIEKNNNRKKKELVDGGDGDDASKKNSEKKKDLVDGENGDEGLKKNSRKKKDFNGGNGGEVSEKKNVWKKKGLIDGGDRDEAPKKSSSSKKKNLVDDRDGGEASDKNNSRKKIDIRDDRDGEEASKKNSSQKQKDIIDDRCGDVASDKNVSVKIKELGHGDNTPKNDNREKKEFENNGDGDEASKNNREKKVLVDDGDGDEASEKKNNRKKRDIVDGRNGDEALEKKNSKKKKDLVDGRDGDRASKKNNSRKKKDLVDGRDGGEASTKKYGPVGDFDEDDEDEENLEQNAARMLSSRFDPSCTGFTSRRRSSSQKESGSYFPIPSTLGLYDHQANSFGGVGPSLEVDDYRTDDKSRPLRPRKEDQGKGSRRKRRHFYEISPKDIEPHWVLNRKIKVFWPLDESWYDGIVNDYHRECKLYHIRYDDYDEEWIDLDEEKFKLLLFPSEVPGREKLKNISGMQKNAHKVETIPPDCKGTDLDSEPIASWLSRSSQRGKSLHIARLSHMDLPFVTPWSPYKSNTSYCKQPGPKERSNAVSESTSTPNLVANECTFQGRVVISNQLVYARKKAQTSGERGRSLARLINNDTSASRTINSFDRISVHMPTTRKVNFGRQLWSIDQHGKLCLNVMTNRFRMQTCLPLLHNWGFFLQIVDFYLLQNIFMAQHGLLLPISPAVMMEMLFIDSRGLNFLLLEGWMEQALAVVFKILIYFIQAEEPMNSDMQSPVTSIRFRLSVVQDPKKNHVFEFHSFSRLCHSKWIQLDSDLLQNCLLLKELPAVECSYDNIKDLEYGSLKHMETHVSSESSSHVGHNEKFSQGILPIGVCRAASTTSTNHQALNLAEKLPHFVLSFSSAPTHLLSLHLHVLMETSSASHHCLPGSDVHSSASLQPTAMSTPSKTSDWASTLIVEIPFCDQVDKPFDRKEGLSEQASDVACNVSEVFDDSPKPIGSRCSSQGVRNISISSPSETLYPRWIDKRPTFMRRGFNAGLKKPRTQVQYTLPPGAGCDFNAMQKMQSHKSPPSKRIRRVSMKKLSKTSSAKRKNFDLLFCDANVLVTCGDKGWRESGALVILEGSEHSGWRLAVKVSGITKFSYEVTHILQAGTTNRYSHAVLWKGGKDWVLEFTDRSQWNLFKEMHEECYNRNVRAASVKNIPIPGVQPIDDSVQPIDDSDDYGIDVSFARNPIKYMRQLQNDVEMALDPSRILYDLDSDDDQWLMSNKKSGCKNEFDEMSEDFLEKTMDMFEKVSYAKHRDNFTDDEIQELVSGLGSVEAVKLVYGHWKDKRGRKEMALLRHLQPPLWERYQRQLKEWENTATRGSSAAVAGILEKARIPEKPPMFAFCLKPRGLDVRNKSFKHRSQRRLPASPHLHSRSGTHDSFYSYGRRSNGHTPRGEKVLYSRNIHDFPDISPSLTPAPAPSMRMLSPMVALYALSAAVSVASPSPRVYRLGRKKIGQQIVPGRRRKKNRAQEQDVGLPDSSSQMNFSEEPCAPSVENMSNIDIIECRMREASAAAQRAHEVAKFKRERANRLFNKADIAVQKAAAALMKADAIKVACESSNGGN